MESGLKHFKIILEKMCEYVNANFDDCIEETGGHEHWAFNKYSWTIEKESEYKKWLIDYMKKNKDARKELMTWPWLITRKKLNDFADEFILIYGWKYEWANQKTKGRSHDATNGMDFSRSMSTARI